MKNKTSASGALLNAAWRSLAASRRAIALTRTGTFPPMVLLVLLL
jgi:hypothetical protein